MEEESTTSQQSRSETAQQESSSESLKQAMHLFGEWKEYLGYFISAKIDGIKQKALSIILLVAIALVAGIALAGGLVTAVVLLLVGSAQAVGEALGRQWMGNIIIGGGLLVLVGIGLLVGRSVVMGLWRKSMVKKYEQRRTEQHERFGHDIRQRAAEHRQSGQA